MDSPEVPSRDIQRELVLQQIKNPISREIVRSTIPANRIANYELSGHEGQQNAMKIFELARTDGGDALRYIFGIAAVAQNPDQLHNAFATLASLQHYGLVHDKEAAPVLDKAYYDFLRTSTNTPFASDGARSIQAQMIAFWNRTGALDPQDSGRAMSLISEIYQSAISYGDQKQVNEKHWLEGYMLAVLDPNTPFNLRKALLAEGPIRLNFFRSSYGREDGRFARDASIWRSVDASWVYPDLFGGKGNGGDVKDWEIAGLRRTVADLQRQIEQRPQAGTSNEHERQQLRAMMSRLQQVIKDNEEKLKIYKEIGQHPLDALGLGYHTWKSSPADQRREIVLRTYRERARKYHYQVPTSDPSFNPLLQELANKEFARLSKAYKYLNEHLGQDEF